MRSARSLSKAVMLRASPGGGRAWSIRYRWVWVLFTPVSSSHDVAGSTTSACFRIMSFMNRSWPTMRSILSKPASRRAASA